MGQAWTAQGRRKLKIMMKKTALQKTIRDWGRQDEVLAHRLGLIPILADPRRFSAWEEGEAFTEANTIVFRLKVRCYKDKNTGEIVNGSIFSRHLEWLPRGSELPEEEEQKFTSFNASQSDTFEVRPRPPPLETPTSEAEPASLCMHRLPVLRATPRALHFWTC